MKLNFKGTGIELTPAITEYATKKISSIKKFINKKNEDAVFHIELARTTRHHKAGEIFKAEVKVIGAGLNLFASAEAEDLYSAIDMVEKELSQELIHEKGRTSKLIRRGERKIKGLLKGFPWIGK